jgi:hypothetical protein
MKPPGPASTPPPTMFYIGGNKKPAVPDGISEEERKLYGMEKFLMLLKQKSDGRNVPELGVDLNTLGLQFTSHTE